MTKTSILLLCLLCVVLTHKDKMQLQGKEEMKPIYQPFTDVPKPSGQEEITQIDIESKKQEHDHENLPEDKQKEYEEFNEMFSFGLVFGTIMLAAMLIKTCTTKGQRRQNAVTMAPATQQYMMRAPMLNRNGSAEVKNRI